jgi:hypothetical protein
MRKPEWLRGRFRLLPLHELTKAFFEDYTDGPTPPLGNRPNIGKKRLGQIDCRLHSPSLSHPASKLYGACREVR